MMTVINIIIGCAAVGIILSAPMGPVGILCVQRTLNKGRDAGFYTGVGAAASDLFYCLLTGLGLSFVTDWIEANVDLLKVIGSAVLIVYAIYLFRHNPTSQIKPRDDEHNDSTRDDEHNDSTRDDEHNDSTCDDEHNDSTRDDEHNDRTRHALTGFGLALSNPLIIFLIVPLFARYSFPVPDVPFYLNLLGYVCIAGGALAWWYGVTFLVTKLAGQFNIRSMWIVNRILGVIILIISIFGLITGLLAFLPTL